MVAQDSFLTCPTLLLDPEAETESLDLEVEDVTKTEAKDVTKIESLDPEVEDVTMEKDREDT